VIRHQPIADGELADVRGRLQTRPRDLVAWALARFAPERRVVVTGLQVEGVAVASMALELDPTVRLLTIDTGRLPRATHRYLAELRAHWDRDIEVVHPDPRQLDTFTRHHGVDAFYRSPQLRLDCCHIRKVAPLERALADVDCWMTGLRREQSAGRATTPAIELDDRHGRIVKVNPIAGWTDVQVRAYVEERGVPVHPLYAQSYRSIGCDPCTRPVAANEDRRAGRWWWEQGSEKECGIHAAPLRVVPAGRS